MVERGAAGLDHPGGDLLTHLRRTHDLLAEWGVPDRVRLAGLCHAAYGTDGFRTALLDVGDRRPLREAIGIDAEAVVYAYGACDRTETTPRLGQRPLLSRNRFTGEDDRLDDRTATAFAQLTIANELDIVREGTFGEAAVVAVTQLTRTLEPYAPDVASRALAELGQLS